MLDIFNIGCRPVINTSKFSSVYLIFCFCQLQYTCQQQGRVEMYAGLFKQNCDRSWITAATLVAGVDTWKRVLPHLSVTFVARSNF